MAFVHPTEYFFYMQRYPDSDGSYEEEDIEEKYDCRYMKFDGLLSDGSVKSIYTESYIEASGDRIWVPKHEDIALSSKDCTLKLRFRGGDVEKRARDFYEYYRGVKVEYHDTFRKNKYVSLIMTKEPSIEFEKLAGDQSYLVVSYTFNNFLGYVYNSSRI